MRKIIVLMFLVVLCYCSMAKSKIVSSVLGFNSAMKKNTDTILFLSGTYTDFRLTLKKIPNNNNRVVIMPLNNSHVRFVGNSHFEFNASDIEFRNFNFIHGKREKKEALIIVRGDSVRLSNINFQDYNDKDGAWVQLNGKYNRVDHCSFIGKTSRASYVNIKVPTEGGNHHLIDSNYFSRPSLYLNTGPAIRIGNKFNGKYNSNTCIEANLFDNCSGGRDIISSRSSSNIFRYNSFINCKGMLSLSSGNKCIVESNYFICSEYNNAKCGGVFISGENHVVINNYFYGLNPSKGGVITLVCANKKYAISENDDSSRKRFFATKNILVADNSFVNNKGCVLDLKFSYATRKMFVKPDSSVIISNLVISDNSNMVKMSDDQYINFNHNTFIGVSSSEGNFFIKKDFKYSINEDKYTKVNNSFTYTRKLWTSFVLDEMLDKINYKASSVAFYGTRKYIINRGGLKKIVSKNDVGCF